MINLSNIKKPYIILGGTLVLIAILVLIFAGSNDQKVVRQVLDNTRIINAQAISFIEKIIGHDITSEMKTDPEAGDLSILDSTEIVTRLSPDKLASRDPVIQEIITRYDSLYKHFFQTILLTKDKFDNPSEVARILWLSYRNYIYPETQQIITLCEKTKARGWHDMVNKQVGQINYIINKWGKEYK